MLIISRWRCRYVSAPLYFNNGTMARRESDHRRYMRNRKERLMKQRKYYADHREQCKKSVVASRQKRIEREKAKLRVRDYE